MGNVTDYLKEYGKYSFLERDFSDVDGLVLAQFSYLKFDGVVPGLLEEKESVAICEMRTCPEEDALFADVLFAEENRSLYYAMCESRRFGTMKMNYYVNRIDLERPSQFSAVTCFLEDGSVYIAFRGTDETLAGWREDFDMACRMLTKSQELSVEYLNLAAEKCEGMLFVGGHSKGGNLAVYSAMYCEEQIKRRIRLVYNLDGPGFLPGYGKNGHYEKIAARVRKIIPHASVVGMLFEDTSAYQVVESCSRGVFQHDAFSWIIQEGHFVEAEELYRSWRMMGEILNRWIETLSERQRKCFIQELFRILDETQTETVLDFPKNWKRIMRHLAEVLQDTDRETRKALWKIGKTLFVAAGQVAREHAEGKEG